MVKRKLRYFFIALLCALFAFALTAALGVSTIRAENGDGAKVTQTPAPTIALLYEDAERSFLRLDENEKGLLTSRVSGLDSYTRNWEILNPATNQWVRIHGKTQESIELSYSLLGSMLNARSCACIRLAVQDENGIYASEAVEVTLSRSVLNDEGEFLPDAFESYGADGNASEDLQTFTIVINYIFDNGGIAFEPYGASVAKGTSFIKDIESPKIVGYKPVMRSGEQYIDATVVKLNYTDIQENKTVNVIYEPDMVTFHVHHHLQNLLDDDYSLEYNYITEGMGLTGSIVPDGLAYTEEELPGFKALAYEKLEVAADGSTVVEIRYDRNYYLVDFKMEGGYGTEPVYTRYGASVGANTPTRHGYLFDGWELISYGGATPTVEQASMYDINSPALITVPNANLTYRARWVTQLTAYTMVFWRENADDNDFSYWGYLDKLSAMSGSRVSGSDRADEVADITDYDYFTYNDALTEKDVLVEGDGSTIVNVYYTRNRYTVTIKATGKCTIPAGHTHGEECYLRVCGASHTHGAECNPVLTCTIEEHTAHTDACIICGLEEHAHSGACCALVEHTHGVACWPNVGNQSTPTGAPANPSDGQIYRRRIFGYNSYYIYIKGTWYTYNGSNVYNGDIVDNTCGYESEHTHGDEDCACDKAVHAHADTCYRDTLHKHGEDCYSYSCGANEHTHGDACYILNCGIPTGHTHSTTCNNANRTNTVKLVYKKYEQSLQDIWPIVDENGVTYDDGQRWEPSSSSTYSAVLVYISHMPGEDFTLTLNESDYDVYTMHYYLEVLPGEEYTHSYTYGGVTKNFKLDNTISARYNYITKAEDYFEIHGYERFASNPTFNGTQIDINGGGEVSFYYSRTVSQTLRFRNNGVVLDDKTVSGVMYGAKLAEYEFTPDYPSELEPNAYFFDGWYTTPGHYEGTEVDWTTATMAAVDVMYYAKWSPIQHTVKVFLTRDLTEQIGATQTVSHGNFALAPSEVVSNGNYIFQGWFYEDEENGNTVEKAFVFSGIPVLQDLKVYAKWSSHVTVGYTIHYRLKPTNGQTEGTQIADTLVGSAIAGHNKTFLAKAGAELYEGYQTGYYPLANSHTVTMSAEADHEYTFEYVFVESMPYAVLYLDENGAEVHPKKVVMDNNLSVVTETFLKAEGKMPDAYQKRLLLVAEGTDSDGDGVLEENVITFRYSSDSEHAYYKVVHYIENIAADGYREYRSEDNVGEIGEAYTVEAIVLTGFSFQGAKTMINDISSPVTGTSVSATLTSDGLLFELYYDRQDVKYFVNYIDAGTNTPLRAQKEGEGIFGEQIVEYAPVLTLFGYTLVSDSVKTISLSTNEALNVIVFQYQETTVSLQYRIVGLDDCGTLSYTSENLSAVTGVPHGSTPTVASGYHFVGWYLDEGCLKPVDPSWVGADYTLVPKQSGGVWQSGAVYYAKIDPDFTTLTIKTAGAVDADSNQAFIFRIRGVSEGTQDVDIFVTVIGNGSVTVSHLRLGEYTVTELTDWSFRYQPDEVQKRITLTVNKGINSVTFSHIRTTDKWLDANANATNAFNG